MGRWSVRISFVAAGRLRSRVVLDESLRKFRHPLSAGTVPSVHHAVANLGVNFPGKNAGRRVQTLARFPSSDPKRGGLWVLAVRSRHPALPQRRLLGPMAGRFPRVRLVGGRSGDWETASPSERQRPTIADGLLNFGVES